MQLLMINSLLKISKLRMGVVILTALASSAVFVHNLGRANLKSSTLGPNSYQFPETIRLAGWLQTESKAIISSDPGVIAAQRYQFMREPYMIDAQVWSLRYVEGNVSRFLNIYAGVKSTLKQQEIYQPSIGYAGILANQNRVYLSSCINPQGPTTLTEAQFAKNRYEYDLTLNRIFYWLLGQKDLMDRRCFFTVLSVAQKEQSRQTPLSASRAQQMLEELWPIWFKFWQPRIPPS
jgi:cyanosortase A-associated protein